jgi:hypothetical protein
MIFVLTVYKALRHDMGSGSLFSVLFRDGASSFVPPIRHSNSFQALCILGPVVSVEATTRSLMTPSAEL